MKTKIILFLLIFISPVYSQVYYSLVTSFGNFEDASAFDISSSGQVYITDAGTNEIYKFDTLGVKSKEIGGYGWSEAAFDDPVDVFATPLNVYVTDRNNHRIQFFDKDLNFISMLSSENLTRDNIRFSYPTSAEVSNQGDLYIVDSDNSRILKFNLSGDFLQEIGNYDAGRYALNNPDKLAVSPQGRIYVTDNGGIVVFDQFGTGIHKFSPGFSPKNINIKYSKVVINSADSIKLLDTSKPASKLVEVHFLENVIEGPLVEAAIYSNRLYALTPKELYIFMKAGN